VRFETPPELLARLKLGREEYCQRLLTTLILHAPYPRWNSRSTPSEAGLSFLRKLYEGCFGDPWPGDKVVFVDEFELPPRHDAERGGAPDYAVLWDDRLWMIELKTERWSHRADQIPSYYELAHHHYPEAKIDLLYVTPPMEAGYAPEAAWARYAHTTWGDLGQLIRTTWSSGHDPGQQEVVEGLLDAIGQLHVKPNLWRAGFLGAHDETLAVARSVTSPAAEPAKHSAVDAALDTARRTAADVKQRAVDYLPASLEDLLSLRFSIRNALASSPNGSSLRQVVVWIWRPESKGSPLTAIGRKHGMELRLSRYRSPQY
jgi:hypothetical protein